MNAAVDYTYSPVEIATAVQTQLQALVLEDVDDPKNPGNPLKAFERVEIFDVMNLNEAFRRMIISEQRVCVIVIMAQEFETEIDEQKIVITRKQPISILISDQRIGDATKGLLGDPEDVTIPGAIKLAKAATPAVIGKLLPAADGKSKVISTPTNSDTLYLRDDEQKNLPGRSAVLLEINCIGGTLEADIGPGSSL
jgi:hypothetical protein